MKKNTAFVLMILVVVLAVILIKKQDQKKKDIPDDKDFAVTNIADVSRIYIAGQIKQHGRLKKNKGRLGSK